MEAPIDATAPDFSQYVIPSWGNQTDQTGKIAALEKRVDFLEGMLLRLLPKTNMTPASEMAHDFGMVTAPAVAPVPTIITPASDTKSTEEDSKETEKPMTGKLIMWNVKGGYGFIKVEGQKDNIFLHFKGCKKGGKLRSIIDKSEGDVPDEHSKDSPADWATGTVEFVVKKRKGGRIVADQVDFA